MSTDLPAEASATPKTVLVVGGSGFLGQFLVQELAAQYRVGFTYHSTEVPVFKGAVKSFWVNMATGEGLQESLDELGPVDCVINCAALAAVLACEKDADAARAINVPTKLLDALDVHKSTYGKEPLLIHVSTDQVYDGTKSWWSENDGANPINAYGRSKREAEVTVQDRWPAHYILRSSIIYGPQCPVAVSRLLFLQFIIKALSEGKPTTFFDDEYRCPIYVKDIIEICKVLIERGRSDPDIKHRLFNMGGPERLSRADMAYAVAEVHGYDKSLVKCAPSSSVNRGVPNPADLSMDVKRLVSELKVKLTPFRKALEDIQPAPPTDDEDAEAHNNKKASP
ncbi:hypothetical protein WJX72_007947 [[Myrmecia] bisecta]|uniref:RmlD-like substrate binding domain-containing protein n=1 Tax=[Myrmecia] bisecta TaxID=41462 RepID=A0AAW1PFM8_9CHLO